MAHHKRRRPKHQRNGCLMCKYHKDERVRFSLRPNQARKIQPDDDTEEHRVHGRGGRLSDY